MGIQKEQISKITKWAYNGVEYETEEDAALAAAVILMGVRTEDQEQVMERIKINARDLVGVIQKLCGPATRSTLGGGSGG